MTTGAEKRLSEDIREEIAHWVGRGCTSGITSSSEGWSLSLDDEAAFRDDEHVQERIVTLIRERYWSGFDPTWGLTCDALQEAEIFESSNSST